MRGPTASRARGSDGFLLVEALAAMAIGGFILIGLVSVVGLMGRAETRAAAIATGVEASSRAIDAIARDLKVAARVRGPDGGFLFRGTPIGVTFARRFAEYGDLRLVTLVSEDGRPSRVTRTEAPLPPAGVADPGSGTVSEAYAGASPMRFSYFSRLPTGEEALLDNWEVSTDMPSAVRISLLDAASGEIETTIRIGLAIEAEAGCAAPSSARCAFVENGEGDAVGAEGQPRELIDPNDPLGWMRYAR